MKKKGLKATLVRSGQVRLRCAALERTRRSRTAGRHHLAAKFSSKTGRRGLAATWNFLLLTDKIVW